MKPIMLALSTFRQSERAVQSALQKAREAGGRLVIVHVVDVNLARYLLGADVGFYPDLMKITERDLLAKHEDEARKRVALLEGQARAAGLQVESRVEVGRFAVICLAVARELRPELIVTTRSNRPDWVRRFFGSPVDELIAGAGCPVEEA